MSDGEAGNTVKTGCIARLAAAIFALTIAFLLMSVRVTDTGVLPE